MIKDLTFITGNPHKADLIKQHLGIEIAHHTLDLDEIQSVDPEEVIAHKVKQAYSILQKPVLVEDASLIFTALGKLPGPLIKWFLLEIGNGGLCKLLKDFKDKSAIGQVGFGFYDGKELRVFLHSVHGSVPVAPRGDKGFGWDPVFIPAGYDKTWAEMDEEERSKTYVRFPAMKQLEEFLKSYSASS